MLKAVFFDFDGLILDTEWPEVQTYQEIFADHGLEFPDAVWQRMLGISSTETLDMPWIALEEHLGPQDRIALRERSSARRLELIAAELVRPGVERALAAFDRLGVRIAIVSSSRRSWVEGHLGRLGLGSRFECAICGHEGLPSKPASDLYRKALSDYNLWGNEAMAIEDSPNGIRAAKGAGLFVLAVPNRLTQSLDLSAADRVVSKLDEVDWDALVASFAAD